MEYILPTLTVYPLCENTPSFAKWNPNVTNRLTSLLEHSTVEKLSKQHHDCYCVVVSGWLAGWLQPCPCRRARCVGNWAAPATGAGGGMEPPWEWQPHRTEGNAPQPASSKEPERPHFTRRFATLRIDFEGCFPAVVWPPGVIIHLTLAASRLPAKPSPPSPPLASGTSVMTEMRGQLGQEAGSRKYPHPPIQP